MTYTIDRPNYSVFSLDLTHAGTYELAQAGQRLVFIRAEREGKLALDAVVGVACGSPTEDFLPLAMNGKVVGRVLRYWMQWDAQPGVTATFVVSQQGDSEGGLFVEAPPASSMMVQDQNTWVVGDTAAHDRLDAIKAAVSSEYRHRFGGSSYVVDGGASNTWHQIIANSVNKSGIVLRSITGLSNGFLNRLAVASGFPASISGAVGNDYLFSAQYPTNLPLYIAPGLGLYACNRGGSLFVACTFDIL